MAVLSFLILIFRQTGLQKSNTQKGNMFVPPKEAKYNCHTETMSEAFELFEDQKCANANGRPSCGQKKPFPLLTHMADENLPEFQYQL